MTTASGTKSEIDRILRAARANGFKTVPGGGGHKKFVDKHGKPVVDGNGPVIISSSPSDFRWREMSVKRLMAAGVLKADPFGSNPPVAAANGNGSENGKPNPLTREDVKQRKAEAIQREADRRKEATQEIRSRLEPMVVKLGGWDKKGFTADLGRTVYHYARSRKRVECWKTVDSATQNTRQLRLGNTLSDNARTCWDIFLLDLEQADDLIERYFTLMREAKGILQPSDRKIVPVDGREAEGEGAGKAGAPTGDSAPADPVFDHPAIIPTTALEALYWMTVGREPNEELRHAVMRVAENIVKLERRNA